MRLRHAGFGCKRIFGVWTQRACLMTANVVLSWRDTLAGGTISRRWTERDKGKEGRERKWSKAKGRESKFLVTVLKEDIGVVLCKCHLVRYWTRWILQVTLRCCWGPVWRWSRRSCTTWCRQCWHSAECVSALCSVLYTGLRHHGCSHSPPASSSTSRSSTWSELSVLFYWFLASSVVDLSPINFYLRFSVE